MEGLTQDEAATLETLRAWDWLRCSPDGEEFHPGLDLSSVVNRLAMHGFINPASILLSLLCKGELLSRGDIDWALYRHGTYSLNCIAEDIPKHRWERLRAIMHDEIMQLRDEGWPDTTVVLENLGYGQRDIYSWDFRESQFSTAIVNDDDPFTTTEEWFYARDIQVWPKLLSEPDNAISANLAQSKDSEINEHTPRGRAIAEWWPDFVADLVSYALDGLIPDGIGHQGQGKVFSEVAARLSGRGKEQPSRTQCQETINAVLRRLRQPESR